MSDQDPVTQRRAEWLAAVNAGSLEDFVRLLSRDVLWLPPGQPGLKGRDAVRTWLEPFLRRFQYDFVLSEPVVQVHGNWAVEHGAFTTRLRLRAGGDWQRHEGVYLAVWQRAADGQWYLEQYLDVTGLLEHAPSKRAG